MSFTSSGNIDNDFCIPSFFQSKLSTERVQNALRLFELPSRMQYQLETIFRENNEFTMNKFGNYHTMTDHRSNSIAEKLELITTSLSYNLEKSPRTNFIDSMFNIHDISNISKDTKNFKRRINYILNQNESIEIYMFITNTSVSPDIIVSRYIAGMLLTISNPLLDIFRLSDTYMVIFKKAEDYEHDLLFVYDSLSDLISHFGGTTISFDNL